MNKFYNKIATDKLKDGSYWSTISMLTQISLEDVSKVQGAPSWNSWWD